MNLDHFGMDTITLAGPLEAKLKAVRDFTGGAVSLEEMLPEPAAADSELPA